MTTQRRIPDGVRTPTFILPGHVYWRLQEKAAAQGKPFSVVVREILTHYVETYE